MHSSRPSLFCSNHLQGRHMHYLRGRQTVKNHLVHMGTNSYWHHQSIFVHFLFSQKQVCLRKSRKFAPSENFSLYGIYTSSWIFLEPPLFVCFLTFCSLRSNQISDEGAHVVAAALQVNQNLQELKWFQPFIAEIFRFLSIFWKTKTRNKMCMQKATGYTLYHNKLEVNLLYIDQ